MPGLAKGNQFFRVVLSAPAIALVYAAIAYSMVTTGCTPELADVEFFGVRVTLFPLVALTVAGLVLIVFAGGNVIRVWRILRRRHRGVDLEMSHRFGTLGLTLALAAFAFTAWLGLHLFRTPCA